MKISKIIKWAVIGGAAAAGGASYAFWRKAILRVENPQIYKELDPKPGSHWVTTIPFIKEKQEWLRSQNTELVTIRSFDGLNLKGMFLPAAEDSDKVIIAVHGYKSSGLDAFAAMSYFYHEKGYHILLVDNRAHGMSEGKYVGYGCLDREDCYRWTRYIHERFEGNCSIYLHGISMGAAAVVMTSSMNLPPSVKGIIADCGFTTPWEEFVHVLKKEYSAPAFPILTLASLLNKLIVGYGFKECDTRKEAAKTEIPIFIIHGEQDNYVPTSMGKEIYDACSFRKQFWIVKDAGHAQSYYVARKEYEERVSDFLKSLD